MTDQISEILHYQGRKQRMCTEPLALVFFGDARRGQLREADQLPRLFL